MNQRGAITLAYRPNRKALGQPGGKSEKIFGLGRPMGVPKLMQDEPRDLREIAEDHEQRIERLERRVTFVLGMVAAVSLFASVAMFVAGRLWQ